MKTLLIEEAFARNFSQYYEVGASLSVWQGEEEIISLSGGYFDRNQEQPWTTDTLSLIWSATKGPAVTSLLVALNDHDCSLNKPVADLWEQFAQSGKQDITIAQLLSHQAGLAALDESPSIHDYEAVIAAIEKQSPNWDLEVRGHGYHPRTYGFLLSELFRRVTGEPEVTALGQFWRERIAEPLELDLWIGLPEEENKRTADMLAPNLSKTIEEGAERHRAEQELFWTEMARPQSLTARAFRSPNGLQAVTEMNEPANRALCLPAMGGIATAAALAKFYACLAAGGRWQGEAVISAEVVEQLSKPCSWGDDRVLHTPLSFSMGMQLDPLNRSGEKIRSVNGPSLRAFGHPGAGGCHGFADPENGLGFAYTMNQMGRSILPDIRCLSLVEALYETL